MPILCFIFNKLHVSTASIGIEILKDVFNIEALPLSLGQLQLSLEDNHNTNTKNVA